MNGELEDPNVARMFYDGRYVGAYMDSWPAEKIDRVERLIRSLGLPVRGVALDYGCGTGVFTEMLQRVLPEWSVVGCEISPTALEAARRRCPSAEFFESAHSSLHGRCDFIFSHHVLEHVGDLAGVADDMVSCLRSAGRMLHILPCGNAGSFERRLCRLQRDGIDRDRGNRFFFEDEGHLRRLTSSEFEDLWTARDLTVVDTRFSNQLFGALQYYTESPLGRAVSIAEPRRAVGGVAWLKLGAARALLAGLWLARKPLAALREKRMAGVKTSRDRLIVAASVVLWPISTAVDVLVRGAARWEWRTRSGRPNATEMYMVLRACQTISEAS